MTQGEGLYTLGRQSLGYDQRMLRVTLRQEIGSGNGHLGLRASSKTISRSESLFAK
jgi:hypothetical protein